MAAAPWFTIFEWARYRSVRFDSASLPPSPKKFASFRSCHIPATASVDSIATLRAERRSTNPARDHGAAKPYRASTACAGGEATKRTNFVAVAASFDPFSAAIG